MLQVSNPNVENNLKILKKLWGDIVEEDKFRDSVADNTKYKDDSITLEDIPLTLLHP